MIFQEQRKEINRADRAPATVIDHACRGVLRNVLVCCFWIAIYLWLWEREVISSLLSVNEASFPTFSRSLSRTHTHPFLHRRPVKSVPRATARTRHPCPFPAPLDRALISTWIPLLPIGGSAFWAEISRVVNPQQVRFGLCGASFDMWYACGTMVVVVFVPSILAPVYTPFGILYIYLTIRAFITAGLVSTSEIFLPLC